MDSTLNYASHESTALRPAWPAIAIALAGCPVASAATAVFGCWLALGSGWLSPSNLEYSVAWGLIAGVLGGPIIAGLAWAFRSKALSVSIAGSLIISGISGVSLFMLAAMAAEC